MLRLPKTALVNAFPSFIINGDDDGLNERRMMTKGVIDRLGALNDEGAFRVSSPLVSEEISNAR
jgi:hypothetical protein